MQTDSWRACALVSAAVALLVLPGCATPPGIPLPTDAEATRCLPAFPYQQGWLGADAAYSVPLAPGRDLWLFGDTFVAPGQPDRRGAAFLHNSIAIGQCDRGRWSIRYHWGHTDAGPADFLAREGNDRWWWLFDGFIREGALYLGLLQVEAREPKGSLALPFGFTGVDLARIPNPEDPVSAWRIERLRLSRSTDAWPASAIVPHGEHVYFFTFVTAGGGSPRILTRLPLHALEGDERDVSDRLETLGAQGQWLPGLQPASARILMDDDASEMSVHFQPGLERWMAVYAYPSVTGADPGAPPADRIWVRTAEHLEGPWSPRHSLLRMPELDPHYVGGHDAATGCYAAKAHPQHSTPTTLALTYVCNLFAGAGSEPFEVLGRLAVDLGLYRPVPLRITLPPELAPLGAIGESSDDAPRRSP